jgi:hypothetical protein
MNDLTNIILDNVKSNTTVTSLISNRFYDGELATIKDTLFPCANFAFGTGQNVEKMPEFQLHTFRLWSWSGESKAEAWNVYNAIFSVLNNDNIANDNNTIHVWTYETQRPLFNIEEEEDSVLYYFMGRWSANMIKQG